MPPPGVRDDDASDAERVINEINSGILLFNSEFLTAALPRLSKANASGEYYLTVSRLVSHKRVDLAVQACRQLGRRLIVVGDGPELNALRALGGQQVTFAGFVDRPSQQEPCPSSIFWAIIQRVGLIMPSDVSTTGVEFDLRRKVQDLEQKLAEENKKKK